MHENTAILLKKAFNRNSLVGLFIDLQECYRDGSTEDAYTSSKALSEKLRAQGIPLKWAIFTHSEPQIKTGFLSDFAHLPEEEKICVAAPKGCETIYAKTNESVFSNRQAERFFRSLPHPTIIIGGVYADYCVAQSIIDILESCPQADVVADSNAIGWFATPQRYKDFLAGQLNEERASRLHVATTTGILKAFPNSVPLAAPIRAVA